MNTSFLQLFMTAHPVVQFVMVGLLLASIWAWAIIILTVCVRLAILPLAIGMNEPGREIEGPMATVILGGLLTSMTLNLLILPTLALRYGRFQAEDEFPRLAHV